MGDRRLLVVRVLLAGAALGLALQLLFGEKPWVEGAQVRVAEGLPVRVIDYFYTYIWWISAGGLVVVLGLLATVPRWLGPRDVPAFDALAPPGRGGRAVVVVALLATLVAGVLAAPRLSFPYWDDEAYTLRHALDGLYVKDDAGEVVFRQRSWRDAWLYTLNRPNNHVPFTLLSKLSVETWRAVAEPELRFANEWAMRMPAFLFGLASIGAMAWFLWRVGFVWAAGFAALFLAIHPWQLRYISEGRGYSLLLLCVPLLLASLVAVVHKGSWRNWLGFGLVEAVLLWAYPGAAAVVLVTNAVLLLELWRRHGAGVTTPATRWFVTSLCAALLFLLVMGPNLLMFLFHIAWDEEAVRWNYIRDTSAHLFAGTAFAFRHARDHYVELSDFAYAHPQIFRIGVWGTLALCAAGAVRVALRAPAGWALLAALALPAPLTVLGSHLRRTEIHEWYVIFALPSFAVLLAVGLESLFAWLRQPRARAGLTAAVMGAYLGFYAWLSGDIRNAVRTLPIQPTRDAVLLTRPDLDPFSPENQKIMTVSWLRTPYYYDPNVHQIWKGEHLLELLDEADRSGRELYVNYGRPSLARSRYPDLMALVEREDLFEPVATLYGFEPRGLMRVYRYRR